MDFSKQYQQFWKNGNRELAEKIFDKNVLYTFNLIKIQGINDVFDHLLKRKGDFKVHYEIFDLCSSPELEYHRWKAQANLDKKFENFSPTDKEFHYSGITLLRIKNNLITEVIMYSDIDEILQKQKTLRT